MFIGVITILIFIIAILAMYLDIKLDTELKKLDVKELQMEKQLKELLDSFN